MGLTRMERDEKRRALTQAETALGTATTLGNVVDILLGVGLRFSLTNMDWEDGGESIDAHCTAEGRPFAWVAGPFDSLRTEIESETWSEEPQQWAASCSVRAAGATLDDIRSTLVEAAKRCIRAWLMELDDDDMNDDAQAEDDRHP